MVSEIHAFKTVYLNLIDIHFPFLEVVTNIFTLIFRSFLFFSCHVPETVQLFPDERVHVLLDVDGPEDFVARLEAAAVVYYSFSVVGVRQDDFQWSPVRSSVGVVGGVALVLLRGAQPLDGFHLHVLLSYG